MIKIHFETISRYNKTSEPVKISVPFSQGALLKNNIQNVRIKTKEGKCLPSQVAATNYHQDGSIRYLLVHFLADFVKNKPTDFFLDIETAQYTFTPQVSVAPGPNGSMVIDTGKITCILAGPGSPPIQKIEGQGTCLTENQIEGPKIYNESGEAFTAIIGAKGWTILEAGPIRAMVRCKGRHYDQTGQSWFDFVFTLIAYANSSVLRAEHQIINTEKGKEDVTEVLKLTNEQAGLKYDTNYPFEFLSGAEFILKPSVTDTKLVEKKLFTSSFNYQVQKGTYDQVLNQEISADTIIETPNEMFPEVLFSIFASDWNDGTCAFTASLYQAYQNFPKALEMKENQLVLSLFPRTYPMIKIPQGVAKTLRFDLFLHEPALEEKFLVDRLLMLEMPPVPSLEVETYMKAQVFGKEVSDLYHHPTERFLYRFVDSRAKGLGFLHFGDGPEWEYSKQGRSKGRDIWINNEYDMPHNFMVMFARTGDRRYFDYLVAAVRHWYDVDVCHFSQHPYHEGLLYTHSIDHVSGQPVPSHQWVEGFLDYYHLTGDPIGLETAYTIGEKLLELVALPIYNDPGTIEPREIGWSLRTFLSLFTETHEQRWLEACKPIVQTYITWAKLYGNWTSPYPDNYLDRVPFMIDVGLVGLYAYYQFNKTKEVRDTLLMVIDDLVKECLIPRANMFFGKQHPAIRYQNLNGMVLEVLEIGYELTGKKDYLEAGLGMFNWITKENQPPIYDFSKTKRDAFTVIYDCPVGPKRCAQTLLPLLKYYTAIITEGLLPQEA
ncbi:hypothetical protein [uncultured Sphaerochaeta sp.]|uniref:exo-rhamnogalacturonan lyase family protein n=1 Tax=uncultured Sphaerochaeta sp. TaxID=886478 RepID=UPI002A0A43E7|nr:hypothetical protein [uncultured Sphaerochaeta sp.]